MRTRVYLRLRLQRSRGAEHLHSRNRALSLNFSTANKMLNLKKKVSSVLELESNPQLYLFSNDGRLYLILNSAIY